MKEQQKKKVKEQKSYETKDKNQSRAARTAKKDSTTQTSPF